MPTLCNISGYRADDADLTITINRSDLETVMMGAATFDEQIEAGKAKLQGNRGMNRNKITLIQFDLYF